MTNPTDMTIDHCDHLHDTTTRYDRDKKQLSFLLICQPCGIERLVDTLRYEPRFERDAQSQTPATGGTVHKLPVRRHEPPLRRAA